MAFQFEVLPFLCMVLLFGVLAEGATNLSQLRKILNVTVTYDETNGVVQAGKDQIHVTWVPANSSVDDTGMKTIKLKLCYGAPSQVERGWRKSNDLLVKDKACQYNVGSKAYTPQSGSIDWVVSKDVPFAEYFVRAYGVDASGEKVAYGQSTDPKMKTNLFAVQPITGRHVSIDIAAGVFSAFSVFSLFGFFFYEKHRAKTA